MSDDKEGLAVSLALWVVGAILIVVAGVVMLMIYRMVVE